LQNNGGANISIIIESRLMNKTPSIQRPINVLKCRFN
jgi:hypothetical protein